MSKMLDYLQGVVQGKNPPPPITEIIGFRLASIERGQSLIEMDVDERHSNPFAGVHGGLICDIADAAMGAACHSILADDETCSTLELKISFLRAPSPGRLRAEGKVIREGRTVVFLECDVTGQEESLIARATGTFLRQQSGQAPNG